MKKILLILLSVFTFASVYAKITWNVSNDGTLTISGTDMPDYTASIPAPWSFKRIYKLEIKEGVTNIGNYAFSWQSMMTSVTIPNSVTSIGDNAFEHCLKLTSVDIPNSVTSIGRFAFQECYALTSITIPASVTSIESFAFYWCERLTSVTNLSTTPQSINSYVFETYGILHVLPGCKKVYENAPYWKNFTIVEDAEENLNTGIANYDINAYNVVKNGKRIENGKIVIFRNGKKYNVCGW